MSNVVGVVLGAGASTRLGRPKQSLPLGDRTLLAHIVADVEAALSLDRVFVVLGGAADEAAAGLTLTRSVAVRNDSYGDGCASSLLAGLDAAGECDALVLLLGDMPGVTPAIIDSVVETWRAAPTWGAITEYDDGIGHPFVFSATRSPRCAPCTATRRCGRSSIVSRSSGWPASASRVHARSTSTRGRTTSKSAERSVRRLRLLSTRRSPDE